MADSHGRGQRVRDALRVLDAAGAEAFIHCGDVGGPEVLEELAGRRCWFVWGNTDFPRPAWRSQVEALGLPWPDGPLELQLAGKRIAVYHGHEPAMNRAIRAGTFDYVLHGHTHRRSDRRAAATRVINPGALHRAAVHTVALLDLATDDLRFLPVTMGEDPCED
ncbi:MAG: metallophosphoesterase family protein [Planctomycetes bacterium]|nr:metallophosphoesterase family protein [Planctomycetota bacterium]